MAEMSPQWNEFLISEKKEPYMIELKKFIDERRSKVSVYPEAHYTFNAFLQCPYDHLSVVILGYEPSSSPGNAHGLAFSSLSGRQSAALRNIFAEIFTCYFNSNTGGINVTQNNDLSQWSAQGVLLLNIINTSDEGKKSHVNVGWETFTEHAIQMLNNHKHKLVFMLWGPEAKAYKKFINADHHLVLEAESPTNISFTGNGHFMKANNWIKKHYFNIKPPVNWGIYNDPKHIRR